MLRTYLKPLDIILVPTPSQGKAWELRLNEARIFSERRKFYIRFWSKGSKSFTLGWVSVPKIKDFSTMNNRKITFGTKTHVTVVTAVIFRYLKYDKTFSISVHRRFCQLAILEVYILPPNLPKPEIKSAWSWTWPTGWFWSANVPQKGEPFNENIHRA